MSIAMITGRIITDSELVVYFANRSHFDFTVIALLLSS